MARPLLRQFVTFETVAKISIEKLPKFLLSGYPKEKRSKLDIIHNTDYQILKHL